MIPVHLGNLTSLFYLNLANNILTGERGSIAEYVDTDSLGARRRVKDGEKI